MVVVVDERFRPTRKARVNTSLQVLTPRETPVPTIVSTVWELDVTEHSMTLTLQRVRCVVDVAVVMHHSVRIQNHDLVDAANNTCSSYLSSDDCDGQLDTSNFTAQELCCGCGGGFQWHTKAIQNRSTTFACFDLPSNNTNVSLCSQYDQDSSTCGMYVLWVQKSLCRPLFLSNSDLNLQSQLQKQTQRYDTV